MTDDRPIGEGLGPARETMRIHLEAGRGAALRRVK